ncbi:MAG: hypothetical protein ACE5F1_08400 [Planctomycetota bacterium]
MPATVVLAAGAVLLWNGRPDRSRAAPTECNTWTLWIGLAVFAAAFVPIAYGSVATADRSWDGFISWSLRAKHLAPPTDLALPFHADHAVFAHSRDYPLLQPLVLGSFQRLLGGGEGRLLFPLLFVANALLVGAAALRKGMRPDHALLIALAFALTPMWFSTGAGGVDSGYATLLVAYVLSICAAGLLLENPFLLLIGAFLLPLSKPEATVYGVVLCTTTLFTSKRREHFATTLGLACALILWLPLRGSIRGTSSGSMSLVSWILGASFLLIGLKEWLLLCAFPTRKLLGIALGLGILMVASLLLAKTRLASSQDLVMGIFLSRIDTVPERLLELPTLLLGYLEGFTYLRKYGLVFVIAIALVALPQRTSGRPPSIPVALFLALGIATVCSAMLLSPEQDLEHEFRSRFDRLLLHWTGVAWLVVGPWLASILRAPEVVSPRVGGGAADH